MGGSPGATLQTAGAYCQNAVPLGEGVDGYGMNLAQCTAATSTDTRCSGNFFHWRDADWRNQGGQCKCATDDCSVTYPFSDSSVYAIIQRYRYACFSRPGFLLSVLLLGNFIGGLRAAPLLTPILK